MVSTTQQDYDRRITGTFTGSLFHFNLSHKKYCKSNLKQLLHMKLNEKNVEFRQFLQWNLCNLSL